MLNIRLLFIGVFFTSNLSWADENATPEQGKAPAEEVAPVVLPKAENIDLKEVISEPLHEALPILEVPVEEPPIADEEHKEEAQATSDPSENSSAGYPVPTTAQERTAKGDEVKSVKAPEPAETEFVEEELVKKEFVKEALVEQGDSKIGPLRFLGAEVLPGTATRLAWSSQDFLAGISAPTPVLVVHGQNPGPTVCLTAAVHGDELNGIEVVRHILYGLEPEKLTGTVIGVPIVNLQGFRRASRYLPDRRDLNRYFPGRANGSSAARIAHSFFSQVIAHCDVLVDLHTGSFRRTNLPQLRSDLTIPSVAELTQKMGDIVVLQSHGARGSLRRAAMEAGIPAVTIEAGEPLNVEPEAVKQGVRSIETLLHKMDMYSQRALWARKTEPVYYKSLWVRAGSGGILLSKIQLGERVSEGQVLATITDPITNASDSVLSPTSGRVIGMALNQVMLPGYAAYHIGYQATAEEAAQQDAGPDDATGDEVELDAEVVDPVKVEGSRL